jgi:hypothetical protein
MSCAVGSVLRNLLPLLSDLSVPFFLQISEEGYPSEGTMLQGRDLEDAVERLLGDMRARHHTLGPSETEITTPGQASTLLALQEEVRQLKLGLSQLRFDNERLATELQAEKRRHNETKKLLAQFVTAPRGRTSLPRHSSASPPRSPSGPRSPFGNGVNDSVRSPGREVAAQSTLQTLLASASPVQRVKKASVEAYSEAAVANGRITVRSISRQRTGEQRVTSPRRGFGSSTPRFEPSLQVYRGSGLAHVLTKDIDFIKEAFLLEQSLGAAENPPAYFVPSVHSPNGRSRSPKLS